MPRCARCCSPWRRGWAVLLPDGSYKLMGEPDGRFWWMVKDVRF
ncbi:hypothetical protein FAIPA1_130097 [Frankia sp. AiPs1]